MLTCHDSKSKATASELQSWFQLLFLPIRQIRVIDSIKKITQSQFNFPHRDVSFEQMVHSAAKPGLGSDPVIITREHSFPPKKFAKFCGPVRKIPQLTMAKLSKFSGLPSVCKLSLILSKKLLKASMVLGYASNIQRKLSICYLSKSAICQLVALCLFTIVLYYDSNY